jgi:hypothetical protein
LWPACAAGQLADQGSAGPVAVSLGTEHVTRWRFGVIVKADEGACKGIFATIPVPKEWPEQQVQLLDEDISRLARVSSRELPGVRQLLVRIPFLSAGQTAQALFTFEIRRREINPPAATEGLSIPNRVPREVRQYLAPSPYIESRNRSIQRLARQLLADRESAWDQVEALYDYARDHVAYREGELKGALAALRDGHGDCEELASLIIALCRASKIPARTVWVPDHCYPEFYLQDDDGQGHWYPCQAAGTRSLGGIPESRPILQKGDNFRIPEKKDPQRYVSEFLRGDAIQRGGRPNVTFVRENVTYEAK